MVVDGGADREITAICFASTVDIKDIFERIVISYRLKVI